MAQNKEPAYYPESDNEQRLGKVMSSKSREVAAEVHLRGMLVDEANRTGKDLDDAYLAGLLKYG